MEIKSEIIQESKRVGIDIIGFTSCAPFDEVGEVLKEREALGYLSGFEEKDISKRINPGLLLKDCKTIIVAGISYNISRESAKQKPEHRHKSSISRGAWGIDYHVVLKSMLNKLCDFIRERFKGNAVAYVDTGPLVEREAARRAGVGFVGKNCSIINPEYGSLIFIGEILTDIFVEPDSPLEDGCGDCDLCLKACPSGALCNPYTVDAKSCISYVTQGKDLPLERYKNIGNSIYGCDVCQNVCPRNKTAKASNHKEFIPEDWNSYPDAVDILEMDNKAFESTFKKTSSGWRGKKTLQRNAIIALGNSGNKNAAPYIENMLKDPRPDIRKISLYSLFNLLGRESLPILKKHYTTEGDEDVKRLITELTGDN